MIRLLLPMTAVWCAVASVVYTLALLGMLK
jgi:hypothetical protein